MALEDPDLFAVADGMGGHVGGEVAARVAIDALRAAFARQPTVDGLRRAVAEANRAVWRQSQAESGLRGMGTTLTVTALVRGPDGSQVIALANVGDSRAYVFSNGEVVQVTADHSLAEEKVRQGQLTEAEAAVHPHRHILTRALGVASDVDVDLWELRLHEGDRILLCSDGLTNEVPDDRIENLLATLPDPGDAARALVATALEHGGNDNVTVVVVDVVTDREDAGDAGGSTAAGVAGAGPEPGSPGGAHTGPAAATPAAGRVGDPAPDPRAGAGGLLLADAVAESTVAVPAQGAGPGLRPDPPGRAPAGYGTAKRERAAPTRARPTRRERRRHRRQAGIPRLITVRVVLFVVLVAGVVAAGYGLVRWYANDDWYVTLDHGNLAIYHGRPGGFLWYKPKLTEVSTVTSTEILAFRVTTVKHAVEEPTEAAAKRYIANLHSEYLATQKLGAGATPNPATSTTTPTAGPTPATTTATP